MKKFILILPLLMILLSCYAQSQTRQDKYPLMYEEKPLTIFFMSAENNTEFSLPENQILQAAAIPLSEHGYYTISPFLTEKILNTLPNIADSLHSDSTYAVYNRIFGADAVFKMKIFSYTVGDVKKHLLGITNPLHEGSMGFSCQLISTKSGKVLWEFSDTLTFLEGNLTKLNSAIPIGFGVIYRYETLNMTDDIVLSCIFPEIKKNLPYGKHNRYYQKDIDTEIKPVHTKKKHDVKVEI